ncbi:50S ribosomal protein L18 [Candidatus Wolfebacteria bacterium RIFCSPLOWO2_01_FULL_38_11]|uniref:Large ribosomal subunit protein uL18 n=2 Tax=Candidatus Wolfeibacteriota TaxID=1752735 RepID=A0A0G0GB79_9BACT|nr:MAG: 50S ribosomal protein L18, large subunit ribosomal protein L18 [Candidatus Wolfebacteria bacterium GW2011_GWC1_37_10]OGM91367.1 MAG: 50S ribosomal protein L18 [Candidatus Wolfebacteria bacterium RIFCSPLOWO2_01_FULL_38_11]
MANKNKLINQKRLRRKIRARAKISGTTARPRFSVFLSNHYSYGQLIDDEKGNTLISVSSREIKKKESKTSLSHAIGELIAKRAKEIGIKKIIFDRGNYKYHGRAKAIAESARKGGLEF